MYMSGLFLLFFRINLYSKTNITMYFNVWSQFSCIKGMGGVLSVTGFIVSIY